MGVVSSGTQLECVQHLALPSAQVANECTSLQQHTHFLALSVGLSQVPQDRVIQLLPSTSKTLATEDSRY